MELRCLLKTGTLKSPGLFIEIRHVSLRPQKCQAHNLKVAGSNPAHATIKAYPPSDIPIGIYIYLLIRIIRQVRFRRLREWSYADFANVEHEHRL